MKFGVFIGRFQPFHSGHAYVVAEALKKVDKLIILIGSANRARNTRNPFTYHERVNMIGHSFGWEQTSGKLLFAPVEDYPSDDKWESMVRQTVAHAVTYNGNFHFGEEDQIFLCGQEKDHTSFYVKKFPEWEPIAIPTQNHLISATDFRLRYFASLPEIVDAHLPKGTVDFLKEFYGTPEFKWLLDYYKAKADRDHLWAPTPFPNKDQCADAVVVQSGHILLVTRGKHPGKGLLALPGGHVNEFERIRDAATRELREEAKPADKMGEIPAGRLDSYIVAEQRYDDPYRSDFGRVITHAFLYRLPDAKPLWKVKGADDAVAAKWYPLAKLKADEFHDDHFYIIQDMLGL